MMQYMKLIRPEKFLSYISIQDDIEYSIVAAASTGDAFCSGYSNGVLFTLNMDAKYHIESKIDKIADSNDFSDNERGMVIKEYLEWFGQALIQDLTLTILNTEYENPGHLIIATDAERYEEFKVLSKKVIADLDKSSNIYRRIADTTEPEIIVPTKGSHMYIGAPKDIMLMRPSDLVHLLSDCKTMFDGMVKLYKNTDSKANE